MAGVMKQSKVGLGDVLAACLAASLIQSSLVAAASHTVGGNTGWTVPSSSSFYSSWASQPKFKVGDFLVFNFQSGAHTVAEVSKSAYDACSSSNPISSASTGPANLTISTAGNHYYICTIPGHCSNGQKLAITASKGSSSSAPSPSAASAAPTPSSPSGSPGLAPSPSTSTIPSALSPAGSAAAAPPPSSDSAAGAGLALPFVMIAAAFLG